MINILWLIAVIILLCLAWPIGLIALVIFLISLKRLENKKTSNIMWIITSIVLLIFAWPFGILCFAAYAADRMNIFSKIYQVIKSEIIDIGRQINNRD